MHVLTKVMIEDIDSRLDVAFYDLNELREELEDIDQMKLIDKIISNIQEANKFSSALVEHGL